MNKGVSKATKWEFLVGVLHNQQQVGDLVYHLFLAIIMQLFYLSVHRPFLQVTWCIPSALWWPYFLLLHSQANMLDACGCSCWQTKGFVNSLFSFCLPWSSTWYGRRIWVSIQLATINDSMEQPKKLQTWGPGVNHRRERSCGSNWKKDRLPRQNSSIDPNTAPKEDRSIPYGAPMDDGFRICRNACQIDVPRRVPQDS